MSETAWSVAVGSKYRRIAKVSEAGKLSLPARVRRRVGLEQGGPVLVRVEDGENPDPDSAGFASSGATTGAQAVRRI